MSTKPLLIVAGLPTKVHAAVPYYNAYEFVPTWFDSHLFEWAANATDFEANQPVIDIVTAPNNPDGAMRTKSIPGETAYPNMIIKVSIIIIIIIITTTTSLVVTTHRCASRC